LNKDPIIFEAPKETVQALENGNKRVTRAMAALSSVRRSPRLA